MKTNKKIQAIVAEKLTRLMAHEDNLDLSTFDQVAQKANVGRGTVERMKKGTVAARIDTLESVSEVFGLRSWQMLVPDDGASLSQEAMDVAKMFESFNSVQKKMLLDQMHLIQSYGEEKSDPALLKPEPPNTQDVQAFKRMNKKPTSQIRKESE